jgi:hypothetical protein
MEAMYGVVSQKTIHFRNIFCFEGSQAVLACPSEKVKMEGM